MQHKSKGELKPLGLLFPEGARSRLLALWEEAESHDSDGGLEVSVGFEGELIAFQDNRSLPAQIQVNRLFVSKWEGTPSLIMAIVDFAYGPFRGHDLVRVQEVGDPDLQYHLRQDRIHAV